MGININIPAIITFFVLILNVFFIHFLSQQKKGNKQSKFYLMLTLSCIVIWQGVSFINKILTLGYYAEILWKVSSIAVIFSAVYAFLFFASFLRVRVSSYIKYTLYSIASAISIFCLFTKQIVAGTKSFSWGIELIQGHYYFLVLLPVLISAAVSIFLLIRKYIITKNKDTKYAIRIILIGFLITEIGGLISESITGPLELPSLGGIFSTFVNAAILISIYKFSFLHIKPKRFSIVQKLFASFVIIATVIILIQSYMSYSVGQDILEKRIEEELNNIVTLKKDDFDHFIAQNVRGIENVAQNIKFSEQNISDLLKDRILYTDFSDFYLLSSQGELLVSTQENTENQIYIPENYSFQNASETVVNAFYRDPVSNQINLSIATPYKSENDAEENILFGVISFETFMKEIDGNSDLREGLEISWITKYHDVNKSGFIANCFSGDSIFASYENLSEIPVFGIYKRIEGSDICVVAEVEQSLVQMPLKRLKDIVSIISMGILLFIIFLSIFFGRGVRKRINELIEAVGKISRGDLDINLKVKSKDEIGDLARTFNQMTTDLREARKKIEIYNKTLERKVKNRTRALEAERKKLHITLESMGDAAFIINRDENLLFLNSVAERMTQFTIKEAKRKNYKEVIRLIKEKNGDPNYGFIEDAIKKQKIISMHDHTILLSKEGKETPVLASAAPIYDPIERKIDSAIVTFKDITKEREIEKMKNDFISLVSHQLRTPVTTIKWSLGLLVNQATKNLNESEKASLKNSFDAANRMNKLINMILNISRLESGKFSIVVDQVDLTEIANKVIEDLKPLIKEKHHKISLKSDKNIPKIKTDARLVTEILTNLLSNSIKYTNERGEIEVKISKKHTHILFEVKDNGVGIPKHQQHKIFQRFFRADNAAKIASVGTGLGLAILKNLIALLHGRIWFVSKENKGTSFYFTLPLKGIKEVKGERSLVESN